MDSNRTEWIEIGLNQTEWIEIGLNQTDWIESEFFKNLKLPMLGGLRKQLDEIWLEILTTILTKIWLEKWRLDKTGPKIDL